MPEPLPNHPLDSISGHRFPHPLAYCDTKLWALPPSKSWPRSDEEDEVL